MNDIEECAYNELRGRITDAIAYIKTSEDMNRITLIEILEPPNKSIGSITSTINIDLSKVDDETAARLLDTFT